MKTLFRKLPQDILKEIFRLLQTKDLMQCQLVCKKWKLFLRAHILEGRLLQNTGIFSLCGVCYYPFKWRASIQLRVIQEQALRILFKGLIQSICKRLTFKKRNMVWRWTKNLYWRSSWKFGPKHFFDRNNDLNYVLVLCEKEKTCLYVKDEVISLGTIREYVDHVYCGIKY